MSVLRGIDLLSDLGVDLPNLNSSWPLDVSTEGDRSTVRSRGRSAKFELILTTRCQYWGVVDLPADLGVDLPNLNSSWPLDVSTGGVDLPNLNSSWPLDVSICQIWTHLDHLGRGVDLLADLGVDLPNLNSSWPLDVSTGGRSAKFELILTTRCQYWKG